MSAASQCRHCRQDLTLVLADLGLSPVANDYVAIEGAPKADPLYPLKVFVCSNCRLAQTFDTRRADEIFTEDYAYFSSFSTSWLEYAKNYVNTMKARFGLGPQSTHVEIASNDGYLLQFSKSDGLRTLGVEPCQSVADVAISKGIETRVVFFGEDTAKQLVADGWSADLITANNVFAHVPDINDFAKGIATVLKPEGVGTIEVQHLLRMMQKGEFDTIYHEHFSYLSLLAAKSIFESVGLRVFDVDEVEQHGGSLRYYVCRKDASHPTSPKVQKLLDEELAYGMDKDDVYNAWNEQVVETRRAFIQLMSDLKAKGKKIAAYGAPAKGCTFLNYCGVGAETIEFTVDRAPSKQNHYIPGVRIPILAPEAIIERKPDVVIILPWNLKKEIMNQMAEVKSWGGEFVTAIPHPKVEA